jgi:hypothetical protein
MRTSPLLIIASVLGVVSFLWRLFDAVTSHVSLRISMEEITSRAGRLVHTALLEVDNSRGNLRRIHCALLLFGRVEDGPQRSAERFVQHIARTAGTAQNRRTGPQRGSRRTRDALLDVLQDLIDILHDLRRMLGFRRRRSSPLGRLYYACRGLDTTTFHVTGDGTAGVRMLPFFYEIPFMGGNEIVRTRVTAEAPQMKQPRLSVYFVVYNTYLWGRALRYRVTSETVFLM